MELTLSPHKQDVLEAACDADKRTRLLAEYPEKYNLRSGPFSMETWYDFYLAADIRKLKIRIWKDKAPIRHRPGKRTSTEVTSGMYNKMKCDGWFSGDKEMRRYRKHHIKSELNRDLRDIIEESLKERSEDKDDRA